MKRPSVLSRPLVRLALIAFAALFILAPTPGNVGGCSSSQGSAAIMPAPNQSVEWTFFDEGLCSAFCWRLCECGQLCNVISPRPDHCDNSHCDNTAEPLFAQCVRGMLDPTYIHVTTCPHSCPQHSRLHGPTQFDLQACVDSVLQRSCSAMGSGSIGTAFTDAPSECTNLCVCDAGYTSCGGNCVDLANDGNNCGGCGNSCGMGHSCVGGNCH
jgi:hypothetical protein